MVATFRPQAPAYQALDPTTLEQIFGAQAAKMPGAAFPMLFGAGLDRERIAQQYLDALGETNAQTMQMQRNAADSALEIEGIKGAFDLAKSGKVPVGAMGPVRPYLAPGGGQQLMEWDRAALDATRAGAMKDTGAGTESLAKGGFGINAPSGTQPFDLWKQSVRPQTPLDIERARIESGAKNQPRVQVDINDETGATTTRAIVPGSDPGGLDRARTMLGKQPKQPIDTTELTPELKQLADDVVRVNTKAGRLVKFVGRRGDKLIFADAEGREVPFDINPKKR